jgi:dTDP-4-dehydrorhamnose 3,5-epimerase
LKRFKILKKPELIAFQKKLDFRGYFSTPFAKHQINKLNREEVYISLSSTKLAHTVRGMHFQAPPFSEAKILTVLRGSIVDVVVNLDDSLPMKERIYKFNLSEEENLSLYIPKGFAHGYQTQTDNVLILYALDSEYSKSNVRGFSPLSEVFVDLWPSPPICIKPEDLKWPMLS